MFIWINININLQDSKCSVLIADKSAIIALVTVDNSRFIVLIFYVFVSFLF